MTKFKENVIFTLIFTCVVVTMAGSMYGCKQMQPTEQTVPQMERGVGISIQPNAPGPDPSRAIQVLSTRITDLEERVSKLENQGVVRPLPDVPLPRDY